MEMLQPLPNELTTDKRMNTDIFLQLCLCVQICGKN